MNLELVESITSIFCGLSIFGFTFVATASRNPKVEILVQKIISICCFKTFGCCTCVWCGCKSVFARVCDCKLWLAHGWKQIVVHSCADSKHHLSCWWSLLIVCISMWSPIVICKLWVIPNCIFHTVNWEWLFTHMLRRQCCLRMSCGCKLLLAWWIDFCKQRLQNNVTCRRI